MTASVPATAPTGRSPRLTHGDDELQEFVKANVRDAVEAAARLTSDGAASPLASPRHSTAAAGASSEEAELARCATPVSAQEGGAGSKQARTVPREVAKRNAAASHPPDPDFPIVPGASTADKLDVSGQPQASLRLHKAQIRALERDLATARQEIAARATEAKESQAELKQLRADRNGASKQQKTLEAQVSRLQRQVDDLKGEVAARDTALRQVSEQASSRERSQRAAEGDLKSRNARLNRALEEVQRYRKLLEESKLREESQKSVAQSEYQRVVSENRKLERQKAELLAAFKKQMKLIDVLKRQKVHIEAAQMLQFSEHEFMRALEMPSTTF